MALELVLCDECRGRTDPQLMCDHCVANLRTFAQARERLEQLTRALDAWKNVAQNLWTLALAHLDD